MQIDERVVNGVTILDLKGKMTLGEGDELLKDKINSLIQQDKKKLVLNLEGVPYIDSAGLGEIVRTYTTVSRQGGKLKLLNLTKRITDLLAITKLLTVFETYDSEAGAGGPAGAVGLEGAAMQIDERVVNGVTILDLKGKMTLGEGDELLKDKINSLIQQDKKKLLLNLEGVPYIDSAGLGEIVRTYTTVSRQGGKLKLLNLTKRIQDLLAITKLLTVFETYESEPDAVKSFGS